MEGEKNKEKISLQDIRTYDDQLFSTGETEHFDEDSGRRCNCSPFSKRYIISILALLGFCNVYALRVNLSVALVAMVAKSSTLDKEGKMVEVSIRTYSTSPFHYSVKMSTAGIKDVVSFKTILTLAKIISTVYFNI